ncbi:hypothetical protein H8S95_16945 [Pontibacter sp. KCTC 32443]|uniref:hypothetical protein n=1 Tax=Pontibacter TaxID=323449 RepID=UPI00164E0685|nr:MULTISPECIES: hypothetical protein [Pontibacter]MBC5775764.1 hypothetical protein [Pontibacter sp. KCTC 32443]
MLRRLYNYNFSSNYKLAIELISVFGLSASRGSGAEGIARHEQRKRKQRDARRRGSGREGTKASYRTVVV